MKPSGGNGHRRKAKQRDLFGRSPRIETGSDPAMSLIALDLREMSERALRAGLGRSSSLIEVAALMVELEGSVVLQDD
ncbi:hypothetical protein [Maricaulis salignorans]|uniref:Uncharacterized protein n=1 Tax=Maricaulis salignorans TaxID=144026 RepID=A0A1G9VXD5_9PROT|nr:hypothetical protein [Maricaulis salignorans]SDM76962.1 hypothetical protein SAMN04488568_12139 [Maricaulis salignorans]